jgi:hypothetical protein|tara:strand:- start:770 stop:1036 length:267 start_codon:yes stop_codon:yes gene_type:complete
MTYSQSQEHYDHVFGSQYDDVRERYASELEDLKADSLAYEEEMRYRQTIIDAGYPGTLDGMDEYEAMWKRTFEYAKSGVVDDLLENNA